MNEIDEERQPINFAEALKLTEEQTEKIQYVLNELSKKSEDSHEFVRNIVEWLEKNTPTTNEAYLMGFVHGRRVESQEINMKMNKQMHEMLGDLFNQEMKK
jgi:hypothetical protein